MSTTAKRMMVTVMMSGVMAWPAMAEGIKGYYRQPTIHGDSIVFVSEGDLWRVGVAGGTASRLTTHPGDESAPVISPDGTMIAFNATYEGPGEVYTMPMEGGLPTRRTYEGGGATVLGWTPDGKVIYTTRAYATVPDRQLVTIDLGTGDKEVQPLEQASDGCFDEAGTLYFVRLPFQEARPRDTREGRQNLWKYPKGAAEATALTGNYDGTSKRPMWWKGRLYFLTDRDGTMNLWSMDGNGGDLKEHTHYTGWELRGADLQGGQVVYQVGADIHVYDIATDADRLVEITLASDMDQTRETWVTSPMDYLSSAHVSPDGDRVVLTARGEVFVAPTKQGRLVRSTRNELVRYRDAKFMPDGQSLYVMSDESGEVEFWTLPTNGIGESKQLTKDGTILRWEGVASPDGKKIAHHDKNQKLWMYDMEAGTETQIDEITASGWDQFTGLRWSSDSRWLAYVTLASNTFREIKVYDTKSGSAQVVTSDRYDSFDPAWSPDGKWMYYLSDRHMESWVGSPWGARAPQPFFPETTKVYMVSLKKGERSPFDPDDEVQTAKKKAEDKKKEDEAKAKEAEPKKDEAAAPEGEKKEGEGDADKKKEEDKGTEIEFDGIMDRVLEVPVGAGAYGGLYVTENQVFWGSADVRPGGGRNVMTLTIKNKDVEAKTFAGGINGWEMSDDGKKMMIQKDGGIFVVDASGDSAGFDKARVDLSGWTINFTPREQWKQMFREAWRLERDYFYDPGMHGVDWKGMLTKYEPLVDRVSTRGELSDLIAQMVSELSALHIFVYGGDMRGGDDHVAVATLGARLARDAANGGWKIAHIYQTDPDRPEERSPLAKPGLEAGEGDVITMINGESTLTKEPSVLLRAQAGKQVLLHVKTPTTGAERDVIVMPISSGADANLRYDEWEYTRRMHVEEAGKGDIGYVHLRAMGQEDIEQWTREFFPVFDRKGLIIDVRHNNGGNIDSWLLTELLRKRWAYWHGRQGESAWNMQYAFGGHLVALIDGNSASDGEAFPEGFRRLGLGKLIGERTWGGGIWLSSSNFLRDGGIATAAEFGQYGPEGKWIIEGRGIDPDIAVDNGPHEAFEGKDAQLDAAIAHLQELIRTQPVDTVKAPEWPDKSTPDNTEKK